MLLVGRTLLSRCAVATLERWGSRWVALAHKTLNSGPWNQLTVLGKPQNLVVKGGQIVQAGIVWGQKGRPLYGVEGWPRNRGLICTILRALQSGPRSVSAIGRVVAYQGWSLRGVPLYTFCMNNIQSNTIVATRVHVQVVSSAVILKFSVANYYSQVETLLQHHILIFCKNKQLFS